MEMQELCCGICMQQFNLQQKEPRMLSCGHSFCTSCLSNLFQNQHFFCPQDKIQISATSVQNLAKNFSLMRLLDKSPTKKQTTLCPQHKKVLQYVCMHEKVKVCASCALFGSHKGHDIQPIQDIMKQIAMRAQCLIDMLQIIENSQTSVMDQTIKQRMQFLYDKYHHKKKSLEALLRKGFLNLQKKLTQLEKQSMESLQNHFQHIEANIVNIRDIPKLIDSQATMWKNQVRDKLDKISSHVDDSQIYLDILDSGNTDLFQLGEKLLVDLEGLKDIQIQPLQELVENLRIEFNQSQVENLLAIKPPLPSSVLKKDSLSLIQNQELVPQSPVPYFNEEVYQQALEVLKFHTNDVADFSGAGDLGEKANEIAQFISENRHLKSLKLVKNNLSEEAAIALFKALEDNMTLQSLHLSQNSLGEQCLEALIDMLNINCTLRDIYLIGNPKMPADYKQKFVGMSTRYRKIYTQEFNEILKNYLLKIIFFV